MRVIGYARVAARVLAMTLAFNAGSGYAAHVGWGIVPMSIGAVIGILAMDAGFDVVFAAERRRLQRWADKAIAAHEDQAAARVLDPDQRIAAAQNGTPP